MSLGIDLIRWPISGGQSDPCTNHAIPKQYKLKNWTYDFTLQRPNLV
jgi:hypothetical protein